MARPKELSQTLPGFGRILRELWPYTRKHRALIAAALAALLAEVALRALEPWPLKIVFDHVFGHGRHGGRKAVFAGLDRLDPDVVLLLAAVSIVVIVGLRALASYFSTVGFALIGNRVLTEVRNDLYSRLQALSVTFHARARSGDLLVRVISDVGMLKDVAVTAFLPMLGNVLILVAMLGMMFWFNSQLALLAVVTAPLFYFTVTRLTRRIQEVSRRQRQREGAMAATAAESIGAIKVVQALSLGSAFSRAFESQNKKSLKEGVQGTRLAASLERSVDLLIAVSTALVLWFGARLAMSGALSPGDLLVLLAYLKNAFKPMQDFAKYTGRLAKATAAGERVLEVLRRVPEVRDLPGAVPAAAFRGAVRFDRVSFAYEPGQPVLHGIDLRFEPGTHVALVGRSGGGKSTLVSLILRLHDPSEGRVCIDGQDVRAYTLESLRAQIAVVLQDTVLFAGSIRDNIACAAPAATFEEIEAAARLANAAEFIEALPEKYDTAVGERGVTLSGGQRQRIAIARAAIRKAPILILDEPYTGLDPQNTRIVAEAVERLSHGRTTFHITHALDHAKDADLVLHVDNGRIVDRGGPASVIAAVRARAEEPFARRKESDAFAG
jgi:ATP-binding cassette, subfamily B, bacterial